TFPYALGVLFAVQVFYLILVNGPARPFGALASPPADGRGPTPLLQNHPLMAVHPPFLYLGFIGFTVPFAFGIAALLAGQGSGRWGSASAPLDCRGVVFPARRVGGGAWVGLFGARRGRVGGRGSGENVRPVALVSVSCFPALGVGPGRASNGPPVEYRAGHR